MSKQITALELAAIYRRLLTTSEIEDAEVFAEFMTAAAELVTEYCGGEVKKTASAISGEDWMVGIHANESLPSDGGIWKDYDTDVVFLDGKEV